MTTAAEASSPAGETAHAAPAPARPLVSVLTVFWNGADEIDRFFRAIDRCRARLPFELEMIAVDNASEDGTADLITERFPWARLIRNDENVGFAPACNQALEASRGRMALLLNPDCEADPEAVAGMARFLKSRKSVGAVGCLLLHGDGLPQDSFHREPGAWSYWGTHALVSPPLLKLRKLGHRFFGASTRPRKVAWLMGAAMMVRRDVFRRVGGMDPEYFMYSEDADWCRRIREAGFSVVHLPQFQITHHHGTSARRRPEFTFRRLYRSLLMYSCKHHQGWRHLSLRGAVLLDMVLRVPIYALTGNFQRLKSAGLVMGMYAQGNPEV